MVAGGGGRKGVWLQGAAGGTLWGWNVLSLDRVSVHILGVMLTHSCARCRPWGIWVKGPWDPSVFFLTWKSTVIQLKKFDLKKMIIFLVMKPIQERLIS